MNYIEICAALILLRCEEYLNGNGFSDPYAKYPRILSFISSLNESTLNNWAILEDILHKQTGDFASLLRSTLDSQKISGSDMAILTRYHQILSILDAEKDPVLRSFLDLSIARFLLPEFASCLEYYLGLDVNLNLAFHMENQSYPSEETILDKMHKISRLWFVDWKMAPLRYQVIHTEERLLGFLAGQISISSLLSDFTELFPGEEEESPITRSLHDPFILDELIHKGSDFLMRSGGILQLTGKGGRRFLAKHIAKRMKRNFLFLSLADFLRDGKAYPAKLMAALIREAYLTNSGICFFGLSNAFLKGRYQGNDHPTLPRDLEVLERTLFAPLVRENIPLILCTDSLRPLITGIPYEKFSLLELPQSLSYRERMQLWQGFNTLYHLDLNCDDFSMRYHLTASEISRLMQAYVEQIRHQDHLSEDFISRLCLSISDMDDIDQVGRVIHSRFRLQDVALPPQIRRILNEVISSVRNSHRLLDDWNMREQYPYGRSISLLMSGPPGTGKTMTANAIAGELGLPLYQVNLANIVDKYIGETEKNLEKAFTYAEKTNMILFFDEADSLFGKRSEVKDSHDKYANTEISYLLQRIESYDGIVILATNIRGNMDPAFLRRIRFVIRLESPDTAMRRSIWAGCLTGDIPHTEIDLDYLAEQYEDFTGSVIKTVFLNACSIAAGKDEPLSMVHLLRAIRIELEKTSSMSLSGSTYGKYAYLASIEEEP